MAVLKPHSILMEQLNVNDKIMYGNQSNLFKYPFANCFTIDWKIYVTFYCARNYCKFVCLPFGGIGTNFAHIESAMSKTQPRS